MLRRLTALVAIALATVVLTGCNCWQMRRELEHRQRTQPPSGFRSDESLVYLYMEELQRVVYSSPGAWKGIKKEQLTLSVQDLIEREPWMRPSPSVDTILRKSFAKQLPTRFENFAAYFLTESLSAEIAPAIKRLGLEAPSELAFGTLSSSDPNAKTFQVPCCNARIIMFNDELFDFLYSVMRALVPVVMGEKDGLQAIWVDDESVAAAWTEQKTADKFELALLRHLRLDRGDATPLTPNQAGVLGSIISQMKLWVFGHELAHVLLRHSFAAAGADGSLGLLDEGRIDLRYVAPTWEQELAADYLGAILAADTLESSNDDKLIKWIKYWGPHVMLTCMEYFKRADERFLNAREIDEGSTTKRDVVAASLHECLAKQNPQVCARTVIVDHRLSKVGMAYPPFWLRKMFVTQALERYPSLNRLNLGHAFEFAAGLSWPRTSLALDAKRVKRPVAKSIRDGRH